MSQDYIDPEILADFFVEAKEHLETIEPNLLELEKNPENLGLLNEIFRPMHSLKGASGFLGLNKINGLAHKAENILDELRQGAMAVNSAIMDVILSATDALRTMVENLEQSGREGEVDTGPIIARIEAILAGEEGAPAAKAQAPEPAEQAQDEAGEAANQEEDILEDEAFAPDGGAPSGGGPITVRWPELKALVHPDFDPTPYTLTTVGEGHLTDFLEEAREIVADLNQGLVDLEKNPDGSGELVNDIFRYFHNIKGNSGIIGYRELNALTHEAETLLNRVRKGEMQTTRGIIDLLLTVVDTLEELLARIDADSGKASPFDITAMAEVLQKTTEAGDLSVPEKYRQFVEQGAALAAPAPAADSAADSAGEQSLPEPEAGQAPPSEPMAPQPEPEPSEPVTPPVAAAPDPGA